MRKIASYLVSYGMWIIDMLLAFWLVFMSRLAVLGIFALFYKQGAWQYEKAVNFFDKFFTITIGLAWLAFIIFAEEYLRGGVQKKNLFIYFARITTPLMLIIFVVDLILFWIQGVNSSDWLRWVLLAGELGVGLALYIYVKTRTMKKPS